MGRRRMWARVGVTVVALSVGCDVSRQPAGDAAEAAGADAGGPGLQDGEPDARSTRDTGPEGPPPRDAGLDGGWPDDMGQPDEGPSGPVCFIDAWCGFDSYCDGADRVVCEQAGCSEGIDACDEPCSGTTYLTSRQPCEACVPDRVVDDGRLQVGAFFQADRARCVASAEACGGPEARRCPAGQICRTLPHGGLNGCDHLRRGGFGWCEPALDCEAEGEAVCGCDGAVYPSACAAAAAGVAAEPARRGDWAGTEYWVPPSVCEARAAADGAAGASGALRDCTPPADQPTACVPPPACERSRDCACDHGCVDGVCVLKANPLDCDPEAPCPASCQGAALTGVCAPPEAEAPPGQPGRCQQAE